VVITGSDSTQNSILTRATSSFLLIVIIGSDSNRGDNIYDIILITSINEGFKNPSKSLEIDGSKDDKITLYNVSDSNIPPNKILIVSINEGLKNLSKSSEIDGDDEIIRRVIVGNISVPPT